MFVFIKNKDFFGMYSYIVIALRILLIIMYLGTYVHHVVIVPRMIFFSIKKSKIIIPRIKY